MVLLHNSVSNYSLFWRKLACCYFYNRLMVTKITSGAGDLVFEVIFVLLDYSHNEYGDHADDGEHDHDGSGTFEPVLVGNTG